MLVYVVALCLAAAVDLCFFKGSGLRFEDGEELSLEQKKRLTLILMVGITILVGFRADHVGTDTSAYRYDYENAIAIGRVHSDFFDFFKRDYGYMLLRFLGNTIHLPWRGFMLAYAAFTSYCFGKLILTYSKNAFMSVWIHFTFGMFAMTMTGIRQSLAVSFIMLGFTFLKDRKWIRYVLCLIAAMFMHFSAIVCGILLLFPLIKNRGRVQLCIVALLPVLARVFSGPVLEWVYPFLPVKYHYYFFNMLDTLNPLAAFVFYAIYLAGFAAVMIKGKELSKGDFDTFLLAMLYMVTVEMSYAIYLCIRLSCYFVSGFVLLIPNAISFVDLKDKRLKVAAALLVYGLSAAFFVVTQMESSYTLVPYGFSFL